MTYLDLTEHAGAEPSGHAPPIGDHRLLGDGRTTALIRPDGEIDWWCAPLPHSDPLLWSLLDPEGGAARFLATDGTPVASDGRPAGPVAGPSLRTQLDAGGPVVTHDVLVPTELGGSTLVRTVHASDRPLTLRHLLRLGGFAGPPPIAGAGGVTVGSLRWALHAVGPVVRTSIGVGGATSDLLVDLELDPADHPTLLVLTADPTFDLRHDDLLARVRALAGGDLEGGPGPEVAMASADRRLTDSLDVLRACTYAPTGGLIASPTTSLPEVPGADRQFDYRFSWMRDGSLGAAVSAVAGEREVADAYLAFLEDLGPERILHSPLWCVDGTPVPDEVEVPGVAGWGGSRPVRVGNDARTQLQYDALGFVVEAISIVTAHDGAPGPVRWSLVESIADRVSGAPPEPSAGIWELRDRRPLVAADIGTWMALDHAVRLADAHRGGAPRRWEDAREAARRRVHSAVLPDGLLPQSHPSAGATPVPDASALLAVICGLIRPDDPVADGIVDRCVEALSTGLHLHRYPPGDDDGFHGIEATFVPCSFWVVTALASIGRRDEAEARFTQLDVELPRLLAEQWDPRTGRSLGNAPLAWSHIEVVRALYALDDTVAA